MDVYSAEGVWWRPEASQHRVPGTLTSDEDGVQLVVYGPLRPSIPSKVGVNKIEESQWVATPVVHGRTRDGADITLLGVGGLLSLPVPCAAECANRTPSQSHVSVDTSARMHSSRRGRNSTGSTPGWTRHRLRTTA